MGENVGLAGALYAHIDDVTNEIANQVAEFRGGWTVEIVTTTAEWFGQRRIRKSAEVVRTDVLFNITEVAFKALNLETLHGLTKNESDLILDGVGATVATSYTLDEDTTPNELQWLVECQMGGKTLQAFAEDAIILGAPINFTNMDVVVTDVNLLLYAPTGTLMKVLLEN